MFIIFITYFIPFLIWESGSSDMSHAIGMGSMGGTIASMFSTIIYTSITHIFIVIISIISVLLIKKENAIDIISFYIFVTVFIDIPIVILMMFS